jgi:hypothetical protein
MINAIKMSHHHAAFLGTLFNFPVADAVQSMQAKMT